MARYNVNIVARRKPALVGAKKFTAHTLEPVAGHCGPDFFGNGYTKPGFGMFTGRVDDDKVPPDETLAFFAQFKELRAFQDPA